tara:strand:+ start:13115 stop:17023 length:3909 start_codon:yes stop_codon:yes gene_type:complete
MKISKYLLIFGCLVLLLSCDFKPSISFDGSRLINQEPLVLILKHRQDSLSSEISNHVSKALSYSKLPTETIDLGLISGGLEINSSVRTIVITSFLVSTLSEIDVEKITTFVAKGNKLVFLGAVTYDQFAFLQGILPFSDYTINREAKGVYFHKNVFPEDAGKKYFSQFEPPHGGLTRDQFTSRVTIAAGAGNDPNYPLLVINKVGLGEVITLNSELLYEKLYRGLIFTSILKGLDGIPYSVANVSTIFLDDFPAPVYNEKLPPIDEEYDLTHSQFIVDEWWPDMKAFADTFNISYSAMTAFNYNANVIPPFDFHEWTAGKKVIDNQEVDASIYLARDVLKTKHELAYHGYNHFSLWLEDWDNVNFMASSVYAARKRWRIDRLGDLPISYVPPTNYIDSVGISAIMKGMPSIKYMSSLYLGDILDGTGREFGYEPYAPDDRLFDYPRISSGFTMNENSLFEQQGMQMLTGIWTHFIHPDDVFQVLQREEDVFGSRNPLKLGWKTHPVYGYGLYHVFRERIKYTNDRYPGSRYLTAAEGGAITEDWRNKFVRHKDGRFNRVLFARSNPGYQKKSEIDIEKDFWYTYVSDLNSEEFEEALSNQNIEFDKSNIWDGGLYQFYSVEDSLVLPNFDPKYRFDTQFLSAQLNQIITRSRQYQTEFTDEFGNIIQFLDPDEDNWVDNRLNDAIRAYQNDPDDYANQEKLITLSIEFSDIQRAIIILERRLLSSKVWDQKDVERLFTFYGWDGETTLNAAENFLERLWLRYRSQEVVDVKNYAVSILGLYSPEFILRWILREKSLHPNDEKIALEYTRIIENQENWPILKKELKRLITTNPESDSLYAYTLQRSFYYEPPNESIKLLEEFPTSKHSQLTPFATNLALIYAYDLNNYSRALYWANRSENFDNRLKLDWLAQLNLYSEYRDTSNDLLQSNPDDDSLRVQIGTQLYYEGFIKEGRDVLYPLFQKKPQGKTSAHNLINTEMQFFSYEERKSLYRNYPAFFNDQEYKRLRDEHRWFEGTKLSIYGEYRDDNFDNRFARFGVSTQFGNRRRKTHTFKLEDLFFEGSGATSLSNYSGAGYEYSHRYSDQLREFKLGGVAFFGESNLIGEIFTSLSRAGVSSFTSGELSFGPVLTNVAVRNKYYQFQFEAYREDNWLKEKIVSTLSGGVSYYTNSVNEYEATGRLYYQIRKNRFRIRPIASLSIADASKNFPSGIPFYTPENYFEQGFGVDFRFRNPNTFEYFTLLDLEIMAKHELRDGIFGTGRIQLENKFNRYWEFKIGSEISTSKIYSSNRIFFTLSYYFKRKLIP